MIEIRGVTEIIGAPGTGKTFMAIKMAQNLRTVYISNAIFKHAICPDKWLLKRFDSFLEMKVFITNDFTKMVQEFDIQCIIIDSLDAFLDAITKPLNISNDIFHMMRILKKLCFQKNISVLITNCLNSKLTVFGYRIFNTNLGLDWAYIPNTKYLLNKAEDGKRRVTQIKGGIFESEYLIDDRGFVLLSEIQG